LINCYPYWEGVDIKIAGFYLQEMYSKTLGLANGKKLLYPKQVGQVKGETVQSAVPSSDNMMKYYIKTQLWQKNANVDVFIFLHLMNHGKFIQKDGLVPHGDYGCR
jgi:exo-beta-1,3-glucanase (GH17 family)